MPLIQLFSSPLLVPHTSVTSVDSSVVSYISAATLTAFTWDWVLSLAEDVQIARKCGLTYSIFAYFLSRTGILAMCIIYAMLARSADAPHCETLFLVGEIFVMIATSATSFLFFVRVRAIYDNTRSITVFFGTFWLGVVATSSLTFFSVRASNTGISSTCMIREVKPWALAFLWMKAAYDTSIFFAISLRIASYALVGNTSKLPIGCLLRGSGLSRISRELLWSGQLYYFVTIGMTIGGAVMSLVPVRYALRILFADPTLALESSMACRVFRAVVLGSISERPETFASICLTTFIPPGQEGLSSDVRDVEVSHIFEGESGPSA